MTQDDEWKKYIDEYKNSGMSFVAFSKAHGIKCSTLKSRFYKFRDLEQKIKKSSFKELPKSSSGLKIKWNNITIEIESDFDPNTLKQFLGVLS